MCTVLNAFVSVLEVEVNIPGCVQSMTVINWPLLILTDSPEFPRKLTIAGTVRMCENEAKVTNKRFGKLVYKGPAPFNYFLAIQISSSLSRGEFDALRVLVSV